MNEYKLELFADYFQFYLQDDDISRGNPEGIWTKEAVSRHLAVTPEAIRVMTARNMDVPVLVAIHDGEPSIDLSVWDKVNRCSLKIETGQLVVAGCSDYFPDALRIDLKPQTYEAIILYSNLESLHENDLEGDDHYEVHLFPGQQIEPVMIKG